MEKKNKIYEAMNPDFRQSRINRLIKKITTTETRAEIKTRRKTVMRFYFTQIGCKKGQRNIDREKQAMERDFFQHRNS